MHRFGCNYGKRMCKPGSDLPCCSIARRRQGAAARRSRRRRMPGCPCRWSVAASGCQRDGHSPAAWPASMLNSDRNRLAMPDVRDDHRRCGFTSRPAGSGHAGPTGGRGAYVRAGFIRRPGHSGIGRRQEHVSPATSRQMVACSRFGCPATWLGSKDYSGYSRRRVADPMKTGHTSTFFALWQPLGCLRR